MDATGLRSLGKTGIVVSPIGLGAWQFSQGKGAAGMFWKPLAQETVREVVRESLAAGITWIDTAEIYGRGRSEESVADALEASGAGHKKALVATQWFPLFRTARSIGRTIHERIRRLNGWPITLYQVHMPTSLSTIPAQMRAMASPTPRSRTWACPWPPTRSSTTCWTARSSATVCSRPPCVYRCPPGRWNASMASPAGSRPVAPPAACLRDLHAHRCEV